MAEVVTTAVGAGGVAVGAVVVVVIYHKEIGMLLTKIWDGLKWMYNEAVRFVTVNSRLMARLHTMTDKMSKVIGYQRKIQELLQSGARIPDVIAPTIKRIMEKVRRLEVLVETRRVQFVSTWNGQLYKEENEHVKNLETMEKEADVVQDSITKLFCDLCMHFARMNAIVA